MTLTVHPKRLATQRCVGKSADLPTQRCVAKRFGCTVNVIAVGDGFQCITARHGAVERIFMRCPAYTAMQIQGVADLPIQFQFNAAMSGLAVIFVIICLLYTSDAADE